MTDKNSYRQEKIQTAPDILEIQENEEKTRTVEETAVVQNSKIVSDEVIIEIVHAFKDIIIEFIHRKYQISSK